MANVEPPAISTPSRPRYSLNPKRSGTFTSTGATSPSVAGFSPGGKVFEGYSYLSRSTSMSTSTRSRPKGLQSRSSDLTTTPPTATLNLSSPSSPHISRTITSPASSPVTNTVDLPRRSKTIHQMPSAFSTPELGSISVHPSRSESESQRVAEAVANLPHNPKAWLPSQVALYLTHVLGLVPRPVVDDVTAYVRSERMGGRAFLRLSEKDLERQGLNLKWRKLMIEAVRKLRRDALRGRIWGYESGSLRWPKSTQDFERDQVQDEDDLPLEDTQDGIVRASKTTSKLTLKRMRDSRKVRGIIQAFQTSSEKDVASSNLEIDAVFGRGYVRGQAKQILSEAKGKKFSLRRPLRARRSTADFPWLESSAEAKREDVKALLASLSEQEADDLANELGLRDLGDAEAVGRALRGSHAESEQDFERRREASGGSAEEMMLMPTLARHDSTDSTSVEGDSSISEYSGTESEADFADDVERSSHKPRYSVLDEDVIRAILADDDLGQVADQEAPFGDGGKEASPNAVSKSQLTRSHTTASIVRPSRPYRGSLYTQDELAALDNGPFHTRTESSRELVEALDSSDFDRDNLIAEPHFGTARLRSAAGNEQDAPRIPNFQQSSPSPQQSTSVAESTKDGEYIFELPDATSSRVYRSRANSIRLAGRKATFGSKRGKAVLSLLNNPDIDLFASLPGATVLRQKSSSGNAAAADEEGWGGTVGRISSRKSLNSVFEPDNAPTPFRKRVLDRVASEADGEAFHAKLDELESEPEMAVDRYEDTNLSEVENEVGMHRRASAEQRMSKLFNNSIEIKDSTADGGDAVKGTVQATGTGEALHDASTIDHGVDVEPVPVETFSAESNTDVEPEPISQLAKVEDANETKENLSEPTQNVESALDLFAAEPVVKQASTKSPAYFESTFAEPLYSTRSRKDADEQPGLVEHRVGTESFDMTLLEDEHVSQMLVPLTVLEPHPSGPGSIKKRSMVLVDRKRFESLARRMTHLESQLDSLDAISHSRNFSEASNSGLRTMFNPNTPTHTLLESESDPILDTILTTGIEESSQSIEQPSTSLRWRSYISPSNWISYLSSLNPYYSTVAEEEGQVSLYELLGRHESEQEKHLLSIGAIPAYMLGLGAGVGFVLVREVLSKSFRH